MLHAAAPPSLNPPHRSEPYILVTRVTVGASFVESSDIVGSPSASPPTNWSGRPWSDSTLRCSPTIANASSRAWTASTPPANALTGPEARPSIAKSQAKSPLSEMRRGRPISIVTSCDSWVSWRLAITSVRSCDSSTSVTCEASGVASCGPCPADCPRLRQGDGPAPP